MESEQHSHFAIHKPYGYLSQFVNHGKGKHPLLGELYNFPTGIMAIGRLDKQSEGLLLLTTDGKASERIRSKKVEKEYYVQVDGLPEESTLNTLRNGVEIGLDGGKYQTLSCTVKQLYTPPSFPPRVKKIRDDRHGPTSWLSITVTEGKFKQVRKMTAAVGHPTLRLVRVRVGDILLGNLEAGGVRKLEEL